MEMDGFKGEMLELALEMFTRFKTGVYEPDETWDGFIIPSLRASRERVNAGWKANLLLLTFCRIKHYTQRLELPHSQDFLHFFFFRVLHAKSACQVHCR